MTNVSTSFAVDADTYVSPLIAVSTRLPNSCAPFAPCVICCACRITNLKLNVSSSSLLSLRIKLGLMPGEDGSGSCLYQHLYSSNLPKHRRTCTYSNTLASPISRAADTLVAGNALGATLRIVLLRELVTHKDEIVTAQQLAIRTHTVAR